MRSLTLLPALALLATPVLAQTPRSSTQIDTTAVAASNMGGVASQGGLSVAFWKDSTNQNILASRSTDGGVNWSAPVRVDSDATGASKFAGFQNGTEAIVINGNHVYIAWSDDRDGDSNIRFNRSTDGGVTFAAADTLIGKGLAPVSGNDVKDFALAVVKDADPNNDEIYVLQSVENDADGLNEDVYLTVSTDGGATFGTAISAASSNGGGFDVDNIGLWADANGVYWAWDDNRNGQDDLFFNSSTDAGATLGTEQQLDASGPAAGDVDSGNADPPITISSGGGMLVVAWQEEVVGNTEEAKLRVSTDGGVTFGPERSPGGYIAGTDDVDSFTMTVSGSNIVCVWDDDRGGADQVFVNVSSDMGASFTETQITTTGGGFVRVTRDGGDIALVYTGGPFPNATLANVSSDNGATWSSAITVSDTTGDADFAEAAYDASKKNFLVAWEADDLANDNIYLGGFSFSDATVASRTGGNNVASYVADEVRVGESWTANVDLTTTGHTMAQIFGRVAPANIPLGNGAEVLIGGPLVFKTPLLSGPLASATFPIPNDPCIVGLTVYTQAVHIFGVAPYRLTNSQDLTVGSF